MLQHRAWACRLIWTTVLFLAVQTAAYAQATRTWVSGVGDDANPCSRTAPCKTFAGAISKTAARGVISVLDPGGFGAVTITKSITIDGGGVDGSILGALTTGIIVNAGVNDAVHIRNISIDGAANGVNGIRLSNGRALFLDNVTIREFSGNGVFFNPTGSSRLVVTDSVFSDNGGVGIDVQPGASGFARVSIASSKLYGNSHGLRAQDRSVVSIRNSALTLNNNSGVFALSTAQAVEVSVDDCQISNNGESNASSAGVKSSGSLASVLISGNVITGNYHGIYGISGGDIFSFGSNRIATNEIDGVPSGTLTTR
jgi:hypothetical protein